MLFFTFQISTEKNAPVEILTSALSLEYPTADLASFAYHGQ
jgi:hypothetical protein